MDDTETKKILILYRLYRRGIERKKRQSRFVIFI